jgi:hypothetical protein
MQRTSFAVLPIREHAFFEQTVLEGNLGEGLLELAGFAAELPDLVGRCLSGGVTGEPLLASFEELLGPSVVEVLGDSFVDAKHRSAITRHSAAMLSSPRKPSRTMRIFSSAEKCRLVARRMSLTVSSALCGACLLRCLIVSLLGVTMSRNLSLTQSAQSVRVVLTANKCDASALGLPPFPPPVQRELNLPMVRELP